MIDNNHILKIRIGAESISGILDKVDNFLSQKRHNFFHIINLNPDIFMLAYQDSDYRQIINSADSILIDGIGIKLAAKLFGMRCGERMTGTDLMQLLVKYAVEHDKKVMFLGGEDDTASLTGKNLKKTYPQLNYISDSGAVDIRKEGDEEREKILTLIKKFRPDFLFVAYGPPFQERWIWTNRKELCGIVCMGVGGAFKLVSGKVKRAPNLMVRFGLEWLWRFIFEPRRMLKKLPRHLRFIFIILRGLISRNATQIC